MFLTFLRVSVSIIFFINKILLFIGKEKSIERYAWLVGSFAGFLAIFYFLIIGLHIYVIMEFGVFVLMFYGFLVKKNDSQKNPKTELVINFFIIGLLCVFMYFVFNGILTVIEFFSSVTFLLGTYYLTHTKPRLGWMLFILAHLGSTYLGFKKGEIFFGIFQIASGIIAIVGFLFPKQK
ncbi:MAG: nicotinamide mononucleotide transporter [Burkholderiales bacterium]|nr:nicotinamide mononucleotide transporter [Burkholderiales bacterium]